MPLWRIVRGQSHISRMLHILMHDALAKKGDGTNRGRVLYTSADCTYSSTCLDGGTDTGRAASNPHKLRLSTGTTLALCCISSMFETHVA
jgi:hypothetical protein